jgi:predicted transcriptional regulator
MKLHRWKDIRRGKLSAKKLAEVEKQVREELLDLSLRDLRKSLGITQHDVAKAIGMAQSEISRLERRDDFHVSTLRKVVKALGGDLEISAVFGKKRVRVA